jgi:acetyl esterase/lipase
MLETMAVPARVLAGALTLVLAAGCAAQPAADPAADPSAGPSADRAGAPTGASRAVHEDFLPGLSAGLHLPADAVAAPVVVMVPGGAWRTADPAGLLPLARWLAGSGAVAVTTTHRAADAGGRFPEPVAQVLCAVGFAVWRTRQAGIEPSAVVLLGHSSGGHLAALAALSGDHFRGACPHPPATVDALVGLAGAYDVRRAPDVAGAFFGSSPAADPAAWAEGNPLTWVGRGSKLRVLLAHGTADELLPPSYTTQLADALRGAGHAVTVSMVDGADHATVFAAPVIGPTVTGWLSHPTPGPT